MKLSLIAQRFDLNGCSFWTGLDVGDVPPTPSSSVGIAKKSDRKSEELLFRLALETGLMIQAYRQEKQGDLIHNVIPIRGKEASLSNQGSLVFPMHVEAPHLEDRPDYLALLCLRSEPHAYTRYAHRNTILAGLRPEIILELMKPQFALKVGESWGDEGYKVVSILEKNGDLCLNMGNMTALNKTAQLAFDDLQWRLREPGVVTDVHLLAGDMLLINNKTCVHGRAPFKTDYSRWLQRVYLKWPK